MSECKHGIPLVNGIGCIICSNRRPAGKVVVKLTKSERITEEMRRLSRLSADQFDEVPLADFI